MRQQSTELVRRARETCTVSQALAAALASFGYLYLRRLYTINPDAVYRLAMLQLNTNPGVLEVSKRLS